jgi:hypothetical protein
MVRLACDFGILLGAKNDLREALAIAQINENDAPVIAA